MSRLFAVDVGSERYPALTGIRAFGAFVVFFDHFPPWPDQHITINVMAFFFVLSGFLIVRLYHDPSGRRRPTLGRYFTNRFARIVPVYFLLLGLAWLLGGESRFGVLLMNFTLTHALFPGTTMLIPPSWTLTVEECFYALAPLFMALIRWRGFGAAFAAGWALLLVALWISRWHGAFLGSPMFVLSTTFFGHFVEFFAGVGLALMILRREAQPAAPAGRAWATWAGLAGVLMLGLAMSWVYRQVPLNPWAIVLINNFLIPWPIALLYWGLMREPSWLARRLSGRTMGWLGRASYSFYLLHAMSIEHLGEPLAQWLPGFRTACVLLTCGLTWALSVLLFRVFEEPMNHWIRRAVASRGHTRSTACPD